MKRYLAVWKSSNGDWMLDVVSDPVEAIARSDGRCSPLFPATIDADPIQLGDEGILAFLVSHSNSETLSKLMSDFGDEIPPRVFISHGHAAVIISLSDRTKLDALLSGISELLIGFEVWSYQREVDGACRLLEISSTTPDTCEFESVPPVHSEEDVGAAALWQFQQFALNLQLSRRISCSYAPDFAPLFDYIEESVGKIASDISSINSATDPPYGEVMRKLVKEGVLVEVNAELTHLNSQLGSGVLQLLANSYPVGEFSLLGIGSIVRATWKMYRHLNEVLGQFDHAGTIQNEYPDLDPFDPYGPSNRGNFAAWRSPTASVQNFPPTSPKPTRFHIPLFSSRWGFHENFHSISISWQCLTASATREWNFVTLSHEFLHSHVRTIFGLILRDTVDDSKLRTIIDRYNAQPKGNGTSAMQSMQLAYIEALVGIRAGYRLADKISPGVRIGRQAMVPETIDAAFLQDLMESHSGLIHELVVHILDYHYVYDGREWEYVDSIWNSWSVIPNVASHLEHYLLRTICALSTSYRPARPESPDEIFRESVRRLRVHLERINADGGNKPVVGMAIEFLSDDHLLQRLNVMFLACNYVTRLTMSFFYDQRVCGSMLEDDLLVSDEEGKSYRISAGEFPGNVIRSPIGFFLDQLSTYNSSMSADEIEYRSLWQLLIIN